jgi:hypothetical protein
MRIGDLHKAFAAGSSELLNLVAHLAILFEDLRIEVAGIQAPDGSLGAMDTITRAFRQLYFVRKSLVTLSEAAGCIKTIAANAEFREAKAKLNVKNLDWVTQADSYFSRNIGLINRYRNEFGAQLDTAGARRATTLLMPGNISKVGFADQPNNNFVLQCHFAEAVLNRAVLSRLEPGIDLPEEYKAALKVVADSILHTQRATPSLVYGFLWDRFG